METVNLAKAKANMSALISRAERGQETLIMRRGVAVAKLIPVIQPKRAVTSMQELRAKLPKNKNSSATLLRSLRDEGY
jgi:antitoxin (DNA-binding transcriptional repressor) of toxin-antitoxin stability system